MAESLSIFLMSRENQKTDLASLSRRQVSALHLVLPPLLRGLGNN